jgi:hypothetical protein
VEALELANLPSTSPRLGELLDRPQLVRSHMVAGDTNGEQIALRLLDAVLPFAARAIEFFIERQHSPGVHLQQSDDNARIGLAALPLHLCDHARPKVTKYARGLAAA